MDLLGLSFGHLINILYALSPLIALVITLGILCIKKVKESERIILFRRGRFIRIAGPGLVLIIPETNVTGLRIKLNDLSKEIPGWQGLPKEQLNKRTKTLLLALPKERGFNTYSWGD
jgi:regulator of protease activity HflC (stomatin/prohibitin superfamily)